MARVFKIHTKTVAGFLITLVVFLTLEMAVRAKPAQSAERPQTSILVATANVREGSRHIRPIDIRESADRRVFARRLLNRGTRVPDVVLLQEALGTARTVARTLNAHPRAQQFRANYVVAVPPGNRVGNRRCDGRRPAHRVVRDGAILVNTRTIGRVLERGFVRTWGRWKPRAGTRAVFDCAEQAWVMLSLRNGTPGSSQARIANIHTAPSGPSLKTRAVKRTVAHVVRINRRTSHAMLVVGGDFNLVRCHGLPRKPERADCAVRPAHRFMADHGFRDVVRSKHLHGLNGVVGVRRRIDFIYSQQPVAGSWWDRCYMAFNVIRSRCTNARAQFSVARTFWACQRRADHYGHAGGACTPRAYGRYYSDHPIVRATLRWR